MRRPGRAPSSKRSDRKASSRSRRWPSAFGSPRRPSGATSAAVGARRCCAASTAASRRRPASRTSPTTPARSCCLAEKQRIARLAARHVPDQASMFINIGTTTEEVARALIDHQGLRVITNNINVATILMPTPTFEVIVAGGVVRRRDRGIVGEATIDFINQFKVDVGIIGISGIDDDGTLLDFDYREVRVARTIIENSRRGLPGRRPHQVRPQRDGPARSDRRDRRLVHRPRAARRLSRADRRGTEVPCAYRRVSGATGYSFAHRFSIAACDFRMLAFVIRKQSRARPAPGRGAVAAAQVDLLVDRRRHQRRRHRPRRRRPRPLGAAVRAGRPRQPAPPRPAPS